MWLPRPLEALSHRLFPDPGRRAVALKAVSFALVGVVNATVDFGVFSFFYFYLAFPIILANLTSWFVAVSGSYVMNSLTTFAAGSGRQVRFGAPHALLVCQGPGFVAPARGVFPVSRPCGEIH